MSIVCFEGPSAIGKTTTARALQTSHSIEVIPDVAGLFERPSDGPADWYFERQVERWQLAQRCSVDVVLDGDPFQPLWYNWAYDFAGWQSLDQLRAFYRPRVARNEIAFPDFYVLFTASIEALHQRKLRDPARSRRNFERHLRFIEPQKKYFAAMEEFAPGLVLIASSGIIDQNVAAVARALRSPRTRPDSLALFDALIDWLHRHSVRSRS
jgi:thymidylate kinase